MLGSSNLTLGNTYDGIHIDASSSTTIGGPGGSDTNYIAGNKRNGIKLRNGGSQNGWSNLFQRNRVYGNAKGGSGVDIDLEHTENTADSSKTITVDKNGVRVQNGKKTESGKLKSLKIDDNGVIIKTE